MPKRCIGGQESDFRLIDFSVAFNPSTDPRKKIFANQQEFDQIACNPNKVLEPPVSSMLSINSISGSYQQDLSDIVGVAIDGVIIKISITLQGLDPLYPKSWSGS